MLFPPPSVCITHIQSKKEKNKKGKKIQRRATLFQARIILGKHLNLNKYKEIHYPFATTKQ